MPPARIGARSESTNQVPSLLLDIHQLAKALAVGRTTVENWTRSRRIPSLKIGRVLRYDLQKVLAALAAYERKAIEF
jgi:excisionase family DNA binding protein